MALVALALGACQEFSANPGAGGESGASGARAAAGAGNAGLAGSADNVEPSGGDGGTASGGASGVSGAENGGTVSSAGAPSSGGAAAAGSGGMLSECPCAAPTPSCVAGKCISRGPAMVKITSFYIDSTEVTAAQYSVFQAAKVSPEAQAAECSWNDTFDPLFLQDAPMAAATQPVTNIDYCDAAAFCAWADKRLCGRISGGSLTLPETASTSESQWFAACGGPKGQAYPYGPGYKDGLCNDANSSGLASVGANKECQGYYPGLLDMVGNAQEWLDSCDAHLGKSDGCERIGGSFKDAQPSQCSTSGLAQRNLQAPDLGFRCCSK